MAKLAVSDPALVLGRVVITKAVDIELNRQDVLFALQRHLSCDWGDICEDDWKRNDEAYKSGNRILSSYLSSGGRKFWIITEADRSATTILLPSDY